MEPSKSDMDHSTALQAFKGPQKRAASSTIPSNQKKYPQVQDHALASNASRAISPLERLSTELLEMVFFYSLNVSLPRSSTVLGKRLASHYVKTKLFLLMFPSERNEWNGCYELEKREYLLDILGTEDAIGNVQSDILASKWATPTFIGEMMEPFAVRTICCEFRNHGFGWLKEDWRAISEAVEPNDPWGHGHNAILDVNQEATIDRVSRFYKNAVAEARLEEREISDFGEWTWQNEPSNNSLGIEEIRVSIRHREGIISLETIEYNPVNYCLTTTGHVWKLICCIGSCRIPVKLLQGPWSELKCEALERISRGGGRIDRTEGAKDEAIAQIGLRDAIREENERAIVALVGCISMTSLIRRDGLDESCGLCHAATTSLSYYGTSHDICERHLHRYCVGLVVDTYHLKLALGMDCSHGILYTLLNAIRVDINWADPRITNWAIQREKEGDQRGSWLLSRITSSNGQRYQLDQHNRGKAMSRGLDESPWEVEMLSDSYEDEYAVPGLFLLR